MTGTDLSLKGFLQLKRGSEAQVGESRIRLLERIDELGSIAAAAKAVGLSYKGAWEAVQALNNLSASPLVLAQSGGAGGGTATVTPHGQALISGYASLEALLSEHIGQLSALLNDPSAPIGELLGSLNMKTSARNAYRGVITDLRDGAVNAEVTLKVSEEIEIVAIVTRESIEELRLAVGKPAVALVKSSFVILAAGHAPLPISARNRLKGTISAITPGAVNDEIELSLGEGKSLTAIVTRESSADLGLQVGQAAQALIKASHVILAAG